MESKSVSRAVTVPSDDLFHGDFAQLHSIHSKGESVEAQTNAEVVSYDHKRMRNRTLLSYEEEKKLMRRVDWHLMPLCALIFMVKNVDANNVRHICSSANKMLCG